MYRTAMMTMAGLNRFRPRSMYSTTPTPRSSGLRWKYPHNALVYAQPIYTSTATSSEELVTTSPAIPAADTGPASVRRLTLTPPAMASPEPPEATHKTMAPRARTGTVRETGRPGTHRAASGSLSEEG
jgi:hypothetical protein